MVDKRAIKSDSAGVSAKVLGTFEGECADSNITNLNGLDITRPVWEAVFASEEYKQGIDKGWYIGFLGHPEDPNCMDFEHACIVMTEGHIDNDGKIYGKFNLIDTPVGRIVKTFQDAGVQFGISVRGAGDIVDNSVDPETFVFRGFDLVSFPAYPESIPTFKEIAASTNADDRKKYKAISAAVRKNIDEVDSCAAIEVLQPYFAEQSEEYSMLENRKAQINEDVGPASVEVTEEQLDGVLDLYLNELEHSNELQQQLSMSQNQVVQIESAHKRALKSIERITASQIADLDNALHSNERITANYRKTIRNQKHKIDELKASIHASTSTNLKYKQKIDANSDEIQRKDEIIASLRAELDETVSRSQISKTRAANLGAEISRLESEITAARELIKEYQDAYAALYANAVGVRPDNVVVTASTNVETLQSLISKSTSSMMSATYADPTPVDVSVDDDDGLITL